MEAKKREFCPDSELTESVNKTWMREYVDGAEQKARDSEWKSAVRWKWYGRAGWSLSLPPVSHSVSLPLCLALSSGGWHFPSSIWPLTEGGMNGGAERGERAGWGAKGGWAADGHLNARLPIYWKSRERQTHTETAAGHSHINTVANSLT